MHIKFLKHPFEDTLINLMHYEVIKCCTVNLTHLDFYTTAPAPGEDRGEPSLIIKFPTESKRNAWFSIFIEELNQYTDDVVLKTLL